MIRNSSSHGNFGKNLSRAFSEILGDDFIITYRIFNHWFELVPLKIAEKTKPVYFDNGKLSILATTFQWANELRLNKFSFIEKINEKLGEDLVTDLEVYQGSVKKFRGFEKDTKNEKEIALTSKEEEEIEREVQKYDTEFRKTARKMLTFYYIQKKK
ncbi:MAG: DUF721 domain-containing protein [bacterium]|nr:DUF721 domain-containing protein [bacterium]